MKTPTRWITGLAIRFAVPVGIAAALAACTSPTGAGMLQTDPNGNPTLTSPDGKPLDLTKLSEHDSVGWSDLAIGADGTLHAVFTDRPRGGNASVYYRSSTDGGATWSTPKNLMERETTGHAGVPRIAVDGAGRVYALWKSMADSSTQDSIRGGAYGAPLTARVLADGAWSDAFTVADTPVRSWFPSVAPDGKLHVVWAENAKSPNDYQTIEAGWIRQARLDGTTVADAKDVVRGEPDNEPGYDGTAWRYPHYEGLRGYVDAQGVPHWTAVKVDAQRNVDDAQLVHAVGATETPLFKYYSYAVSTDGYYNPPELLVDDQGREHVLVQDAKGDRKGVVDFLVGGARDPRPVRQASDVRGEIKAFQAVQGPGGRMAAMLSLRDGQDAEHDLWVARYENGQWAQAINVTNNALRGTYKEFKGDTQVSTRYEPNFTAGAFDAEGKLNMVVVNMELVSVSMTSAVSLGGDTVVARDGAVVGNPVAFFVKF